MKLKSALNLKEVDNMTPKEEFLSKTNDIRKNIVETYVLLMKFINVVEKNTLVVAKAISSFEKSIDAKALSAENNKYIDMSAAKLLSLCEKLGELSKSDIPNFILKISHDKFMSILNEEDNTDE